MVPTRTEAGEYADASVTPIVAGMYPDPSVCRVGAEYYLANSSFECSPGIPIWHSRDLVSWRQIGNALTRDEQFPAGCSPASRGVYAPTLRHHEGRFWLITTNIDDARGGHQIFHASDPAGPWSAPVCLRELDGIDPDLSWDDEGTCLVTYCSWSGTEIGIRQVAVDLEQGQVLEKPRWIWHGTGLAHSEGPHLYRRGGWWYLVIAEGGTDRGHVVSVARSRSPRGPFEAHEHNPVLTHRSTAHPVQNVGHADLVERPDGRWAAVYLGTRPRGRSPRFHVNGRETFLADVSWVDDWPRIEPARCQVPTGQRDFEDDFPTPVLDPRWVSPGERPDRFVRRTPDGVVVGHAASENGEPSGLFTRVAGDHWRADFVVDPGEGACTVAIRLDGAHWYGLRVADGEVTAVARIGQVRSVLGSRPLPDFPVTLGIRSTEPTWNGPDDIELGVHDTGAFDCLARLDGRYLSTEVAGGFTGRLIGVWAESREIRLLRVRFAELGA
ncbi:glycoside hydrolase family 43 protein [Streptomyces scabiei]|uniref:glycoside hydrolase family 43 protein n=1 Tax=Streptomyces scabiei TaxID=1930 RepID=UPI0029A61B85|nr:family 43 glycosylhydrolase [Streptomyces scabiei]MDX3517886.1 family 43 glycosylhydrolase [Streptomyces scabiei]